jgi:catechol 2,3-dioxygenase-like lactoylglutathione lyase family enzyme
MDTRPNFSLLGLDHIVLCVLDVQKMMDFCIGVLGGTLDRIQEGSGLYQVRAGNALIDLVTIDGSAGREGGAPPGAEGRNLDHFCLRVEPFDGPAIAQYLKSHGVDVGTLRDRYGADGSGPSLYLRDPEGNGVELKGPPA